MLLIIAFVLFAALFAGWILAPTTSTQEPDRSAEPADLRAEPGTVPA